MSKLKRKRSEDYTALGNVLFPPHMVDAWKEYCRLNLSPEQARLTYGDDFITFFRYMDELDALVQRMGEFVRASGLTAEQATEALRRFVYEESAT